MARTGEGRWITIGGQEGEDGRRHGGSPVFIDGSGRVVKGAPSLTGKNIANLKGEAEGSTHRKELSRGRDHTKAIFNKKAKSLSVKPSDMHALAEQLIHHDREHVAERKRLLADAR